MNGCETAIKQLFNIKRRKQNIIENKNKAQIDHFVYMNKISILEECLDVEKDQILEKLSLTMEDYQIQTLVEIVDRL